MLTAGELFVSSGNVKYARRVPEEDGVAKGIGELEP
jgi:hypothetical protein